MRTYRNTKTGIILCVNSEIRGDWELIPDSLDSSASEEKTEQKAEPKKTRKKKAK